MIGILPGIVDYGGLIAVTLWVVFRLLRLIALRENALPIAFSVVLIVTVTWPGNPVFVGMIALFAPFGVLLPALAIRSITRSLGVRVMPFHWAELLIFLLIYGFFIASSAGALPFDLYHLGYAPTGAAGLSLALCLWGMVRNSLFLPITSLVSLALWQAGLGSSNAFDNLTHLALLPLALIALPGAILRQL